MSSVNLEIQSELPVKSDTDAAAIDDICIAIHIRRYADNSYKVEEVYTIASAGKESLKELDLSSSEVSEIRSNVSWFWWQEHKEHNSNKGPLVA